MDDVAAENDLIVLDNILETRRGDYTYEDNSDFFNFFVTQQILRKYNLGDDDVESGIVDGNGDGGIDGFYLFVNSELDQEGAEYDSPKSDITIDLLIIQATIHRGFGETAVERLLTASTDIFKLSEVDLSTDAYNKQLLKAIQRFHNVYERLIPKRAAFKVHFYASKGSKPSPNVERKADKLKKTVLEHMPSAIVNFEFLGPSELSQLAMAIPPLSQTLKMVETPISSSRGGYVGLV